MVLSSLSSSFSGKSKVSVHLQVEIRKRDAESDPTFVDNIKCKIMQFLERNVHIFRLGPINFPSDNELNDSILLCTVTELGNGCESIVSFFRAHILIHVYHLIDEFERDYTVDEDSEAPAFNALLCPSVQLNNIWESIYIERESKHVLLSLAETSMLFSLKGVDATLITGNKVILLYGPPGTGKTSLAKGLAQKLAIRYSHEFSNVECLSVNCHAMLSKFFGESSSLVTKVFSHIRERVSEEKTMFFVLILDEVETICSSRSHSISKSTEPSDAVRVVNACLTQIDSLRSYHNVLLLSTSNITEALDAAFLDRADLKLFIGLPSLEGRFAIIRSTLVELMRVDIISPAVHIPDRYSDIVNLSIHEMVATANNGGGGDTSSSSTNMMMISPSQCQQLLRLCESTAEGFSGRALRKLPLQAHSILGHRPSRISLQEFLSAMEETISKLSIVHSLSSLSAQERRS